MFDFSPVSNNRVTCRSVWIVQFVWVSERASLFLLHRQFFPLLVAFLRKLPVIGKILDLPGVKNVVNAISGAESLV